MAKLWFLISTKWKLQDVQAFLTVIVSVLSVVATWTFARFCWKRSSYRVVKNQNSTLSSLLTLGSPGEVWDTIRFFKVRLLSRRHVPIFLQCIIVTVFSTIAILSGPIARFSTRRGQATCSTLIGGALATDQFDNIQSALVNWNVTQQSLKKARFPTNQLLDFLPDPSNDWLYDKTQWNSTWTAACSTVPVTPITLATTGDHSDGYLFTEVPEIKVVFKPDLLNEAIYRTQYSYASYYNDPDNIRDILIFILSTTDPWINYYRDVQNAITFSLAVIHMHDVPRSRDGTDGLFAKGKAGKSAYTRLDCDLKRSRTTPDNVHVAYPWTNDTRSILAAYADYRRADLLQQAISGHDIDLPSGEDIFQFYQTYMITKDTQAQQLVKRNMNVLVSTVEGSVIVLSIIILLVLLIILGVCNWLFFLLRHHHQVEHIPETKLEWMMQSMREATAGFNYATINNAETQGFVRSDPFTTSKRMLRNDYEATMYGRIDVNSRSVGAMRVQLAPSRRLSEHVPQEYNALPKVLSPRDDYGSSTTELLERRW